MSGTEGADEKTMEEKIATLRNRGNHYSEFQAGDLKIKFYTSPYLEHYCKILKWKEEGYIEYTGKFSTAPEPIEDSIDLAFIADRLRLSRDVFKGIKEVRLA